MNRLPAFTEQGQGDVAVLLLHGIGGGKSIWGDDASGTQSAIAGAGFRAFSIDLPGYGESAALGAPDMDAFVNAVTAVIDHAAARSTVLLGHSMGGMVAQELVARQPQRVQGLVLACTSAAFGPGGGHQPDSWQARFVADRLAPLDAGLGMAGMAQRLVPGLVWSAAAPQALQTAIRIMSRVPEPTYRAALQTIVAFDRRAALASIGVPTLLLAAEQDKTAPPDVMQRMAARIAGAQYTCLPNAGHIANVEAPAAFNAAVLSFLNASLRGI